MKVILLKDVRGVGQHMEVKDVSDGYATNFLLRNKLAEPATEEKVKQLEARRAAAEEAVKKEAEVLDKKVLSLKGKGISLSLKASEKGGLFKTVTAKDIAKAILAEHALEIPEQSVVVATPIKTVGEHMVMLESKNQKIELKVVISAGL